MGGKGASSFVLARMVEAPPLLAMKRIPRSEENSSGVPLVPSSGASASCTNRELATLLTAGTSGSFGGAGGRV